jgi:hypothetical protein
MTVSKRPKRCSGNGKVINKRNYKQFHLELGQSIILHMSVVFCMINACALVNGIVSDQRVTGWWDETSIARGQDNS